MITIVRVVVLLAGLVGLAYTIKLFHEAQYRAGLVFFFLDTLAVILFVFTHVLLEWFIDQFKGPKPPRNWWL
jgi:hypothetical protein